jgi:hypothetical protein
VNGISVQVGPRRIGRRGAALGLAIARNRFMVILVAGAVMFEAVAVAISLVLAAAQSQPVFVPAVFCPAGQHVTGVSASGWPDCAVNR